MILFIAVFSILTFADATSFTGKPLTLVSPNSKFLNLSYKNRKIVIDDFAKRANFLISPVGNNKYEIRVNGIKVCSSFDHEKIIPCDDKIVGNAPTWSIKASGDYLEILLKKRIPPKKKDFCWTYNEKEGEIVLKKCKKENNQRFKFRGFEAEPDYEIATGFDPSPEKDLSLSTEREFETPLPSQNDGNTTIYTSVTCNKVNPGTYNPNTVTVTTPTYQPTNNTGTSPPQCGFIFPQVNPVTYTPNTVTAANNETQNNSCILTSQTNTTTSQVNPDYNQTPNNTCTLKSQTNTTTPQVNPNYNQTPNNTCTFNSQSINTTPQVNPGTITPNNQTSNDTCTLNSKVVNTIPQVNPGTNTPNNQTQDNTCMLVSRTNNSTPQKLTTENQTQNNTCALKSQPVNIVPQTSPVTTVNSNQTQNYTSLYPSLSEVTALQSNSEVYSLNSQPQTCELTKKQRILQNPADATNIPNKDTVCNLTPRVQSIPEKLVNSNDSVCSLNTSYGSKTCVKNPVTENKLEKYAVNVYSNETPPNVCSRVNSKQQPLTTQGNNATCTLVRK